MLKNISILGSTGSIGVSALEVIRRHPTLFRVIALAGGRNIGLLREQIIEFRPQIASVLRQEDARELKGSLDDGTTTILWGPDGYRHVAGAEEAHMVLSAMVGASGLLPTLEAIEAKKDIALANKETLVMAGHLVMKKARERGVKILPVDSEHSAIFQCLAGQRAQDIKSIILTASGGPFYHLPKDQMHRVTVENALKHPNWKMGRKITIDSATMMNKGLEVIEARWLFDVGFNKIKVVIHPQSIIHSLVEYIDGSVVAQLGVPDMKVPISYALSHPERLDPRREEAYLDLCRTERLEFFPPDMDRFPCLKLAYDAGQKGGTMTTVLNAANEVAVEAFLDGKIGFMEVSSVIEDSLGAHPIEQTDSLETILNADRWARERALNFIKGIIK